MISVFATLPACVVDHGDFTVISNKLVNTSAFNLSTASRQHAVRGEDVLHIICIFPTKLNVTVEEAVDNALTEGRGDIMVNTRVKSWGWYLPYIYGQQGWSVEGDVIKSR